MKKAIRKKDGQEVAVKIIKKKNLAVSELETIKDEVDIMKRVRVSGRREVCGYRCSLQCD